jgi:tRNA threonylcarbamoyladenosine biosynthesis protein TsaE
LKSNFAFQNKILIANVAGLQVFAEGLAGKIAAGLSIGLSGDLGAGKTTFVRFLVKALGSSQTVTSPTYALQHEYVSESGLVIEHWDLYRLSQTPEELLERCPSNHIRLIEWPEKASEIMAELDICLTFARFDQEEDANSRILSIESRQALLL